MDRQRFSSHCRLRFMAAGHPKSGSHKFDMVEVCRRLGNLCYLLTVSVTDGLNKLPAAAAAVINKAGLWIVRRQMLRPMTNLPLSSDTVLHRRASTSCLWLIKTPSIHPSSIKKDTEKESATCRDHTWPAHSVAKHSFLEVLNCSQTLKSECLK